MSTLPVTDLIPQRPPFVMIGALLESSAAHAVSGLEITTDNILLEGDRFSESGLVENMAQTAAAGLRDNTTGAIPTIGYIGALKNLSILELPRAGNTIRTEIVFVQEIMGAKIVQGRVLIDGELIASCELRIFIQA